LDQFPADIQQLSTITEPHHLKENSVAALYRENKYTIMISSYAFDLLLSFLHDNRMMTMLKFVNRFMNVKGTRICAAQSKVFKDVLAIRNSLFNAASQKIKRGATECCRNHWPHQ
jgi:hypothetical protein